MKQNISWIKLWNIISSVSVCVWVTSGKSSSAVLVLKRRRQMVTEMTYCLIIITTQLFRAFELICCLTFVSSAAEEACVRVPGEVCRGAAGPGSAVHQHLPAGPQGTDPSTGSCSLLLTWWKLQRFSLDAYSPVISETLLFCCRT